MFVFINSMVTNPNFYHCCQTKSHHGGYFINGNMLVSHDFSIDDENKIFFSNEPLGNDGGNDKFGAHINHS